jgi:hypothetical protein
LSGVECCSGREAFTSKYSGRIPEHCATISTISHNRRHTSGELRGAHSFDPPAGEGAGSSDASDRSDG